MSLSLDLKITARKVCKAKIFSNISLRNNILHFEYLEWQFNCYHSGKITATLPEEYEELAPTFESGYNQLGKITKCRWFIHDEVPTDNPDFCLRFSMSYT